MKPTTVFGLATATAGFNIATALSAAFSGQTGLVVANMVLFAFNLFNARRLLGIIERST